MYHAIFVYLLVALSIVLGPYEFVDMCIMLFLCTWW